MQKTYDLVIIDAPPRLMTATVNAVCASTHVLVPTILDGLSASAAVNTIDALLKLKDKISPSLKIVGVVPTFVFQKTGYRRREALALNDLKEDIQARFSRKQEGAIKVFEDERILRKEAIANVAGEKVAFFHDADVRNMYTRLGIAVARAIGGELERKLGDEGARATVEPRSADDNVVQLGV